MHAEVDVLHAVFTGPVQSLCCSSRAAGWSKGFAASRLPLRVEVYVPHVVLADPVWSLG
jgi:hypothetical protein